MRPQEAELSLIRVLDGMPQQVLKLSGAELIVNLRNETAWLMWRALSEMVSSGFITCPARLRQSGKPSDGELPTPSLPITVNTRYLRNGVGRAHR